MTKWSIFKETSVIKWQERCYHDKKKELFKIPTLVVRLLQSNLPVIFKETSVS